MQDGDAPFFLILQKFCLNMRHGEFFWKRFISFQDVNETKFIQFELYGPSKLVNVYREADRSLEDNNHIDTLLLHYTLSLRLEGYW